MQAQYFLEDFCLAKIVFFTLLKIIYPLLLPSHNCINIHNVQFSRCIQNLKEIQWNFISSYEASVNLFKEVVGQSGLEPPTSRLSVVCSSQLSYWPVFWWRVPGSNRWPPACKAGALPAELNPQIHMLCEVVGQNGLEPSTSRLSVVCSSQLSYWPIFSFHIFLRYIFRCTL